MSDATDGLIGHGSCSSLLPLHGVLLNLLSVAGHGQHRALSSAQPAGRRQQYTDGMASNTCFSWYDVPTIRAKEDLSRFSCRPFLGEQIH